MSESDLERLDALRSQGILSDEAYWDARSRLFPQAYAPVPAPAPSSYSEPYVQHYAQPTAAYPSPFGQPYVAASAGPAFGPEEQLGDATAWAVPVVAPQQVAAYGSGYPNHQQAYQPTAGRRAAHAKARAPRRRIPLVAGVVAVVAALGVGGYVLLAGGDDSAHVTGRFTLTDDATRSADCVGTGTDSMFKPGAHASLISPASKTLASTTLRAKEGSDDTCVYSFDFGSVPTNVTEYHVSVAGRIIGSETKSDLQHDQWAFALHQGPPTTTVTGTLELDDADTAYNDCEGTGGYDDITEGANVVVKDQSGRILGSGSLGSGSSDDGYSCTYSFFITDVRTDQQQYSLTITHRGDITESQSELASDGWNFSATLGGD